MLKDFRRKVMQIVNRLVRQGYIGACAMKTSWKLIKSHAVSTKVAGTSFDNRQNVLSLLILSIILLMYRLSLCVTFLTPLTETL